jgi:hypothetical protein
MYRLCRPVGYLTALSAAKIVCCRIVVCSLKRELERVWKETDMSRFKVLSRYLYQEELRKSKKNLVKIVFVPADIRNMHLPHRDA